MFFHVHRVISVVFKKTCFSWWAMLVADVSLKDQVDATHKMPDTYTTVMARVQLAQQFCDHARDQTRACESLVHDQHLQQQGASEE